MRKLMGWALALGMSLSLFLPASQAREQINPVHYHSFRDHDRGQPIRVDVVEIDLTQPGIKLDVASAKSSTGRGERVTQLAEKNKALAAINGSFFHGQAFPSAVGLVMKDGEIVADSGHRRTAMGIGDDNKIIMGIPKIRTVLYFSDLDRFQRINGVNQPRQTKQTIVYTPHFGQSTHTNRFGREVIVRRDKIIGYSQGNTVIPQDGFVISAQGKGQEITELYPLGAYIHLLDDREGEWKDVKTIITGAPHLVHQGRIHNTYFDEKLPANLKYPNTRSAVGITHNQKLLLLNVFPAQGSSSRGVTYTRLAEIMRRLGAQEAMGLDGGGSTSLYVSNKGIKRGGRPVTNALIVTVEH